MNGLKTKDVLKVILDVAQSIKYRGLMLNERYLHHYFSHLLQKKYNSLTLTRSDRAITLHPEWPTYKEQTKISFGRYKNYKKNNKDNYQPDSNGKGGLIDFAIGDYNKPDIGIEFTLKYGWSNEDIVFDFLKLLDKKNPFKASISFNVIFRSRELVKDRYLRDLEDHMNAAYREAINRLRYDVCDNSRDIYFMIAEIDKDNNRRYWYFDRTKCKFENGLPIIQKRTLFKLFPKRFQIRSKTKM